MIDAASHCHYDFPETRSVRPTPRRDDPPKCHLSCAPATFVMLSFASSASPTSLRRCSRTYCLVRGKAASAGDVSAPRTCYDSIGCRDKSASFSAALATSFGIVSTTDRVPPKSLLLYASHHRIDEANVLLDLVANTGHATHGPPAARGKSSSTAPPSASHGQHKRDAR